MAFISSTQGPSLNSPLELGRAKNSLYFLCSKCHNCCSFSTGSKRPHVISSHCTFVPSLVKCNEVSTPFTLKHFSIDNKDDCPKLDSSSSTEECFTVSGVETSLHLAKEGTKVQ